jgi:hypothetical protein
VATKSVLRLIQLRFNGDRHRDAGIVRFVSQYIDLRAATIQHKDKNSQ